MPEDLTTIPSSKIKLQKVWYGSQSIVWQARLQPAGSSSWQKCYLEVACRRKQYGCFLHAQKPPLDYVQGSLFSILRKQAASGYVRDIQKLKNSWSVSLVLMRNESHIQIDSENNAPLLDCTIAGKSLFRLKPDKVYTKVKPAAEVEKVTEHSVMDKMVEKHLLQNAKAEPSVADTDASTGDTDLVTTGSSSEASQFSDLQKFRRRQLLRRRKTILGTLKKNALSDKEQAMLTTLEEELPKITFPTQHLEIEKLILAEGVEDKTEGQQLAFLHETRKKIIAKRKKSESYVAKSNKELLKVEQNLVSLAKEVWDDYSLDKLGSEYKLKQFQASERPSAKTTAKKHVEFKLSDNVSAILGRSAKENDQLTKSISADSIWLHALGGQGAHVALQTASKRTDLSADHIRKAAILALHYSRFKTDFSGEVHKTLKRHLKKTKYLPPGKWLVQKADTLFVRYDKEELSRIMATRV